jgi:hypothetical protein
MNAEIKANFRRRVVRQAHNLFDLMKAVNGSLGRATVTGLSATARNVAEGVTGVVLDRLQEPDAQSYIV